MRNERLRNQIKNALAGQCKLVINLGFLLSILLLGFVASAQEYRKPTVDSNCYGSAGGFPAAYDGATPSTATSAGMSVSGNYNYSSPYEQGEGASACYDFYGFPAASAQYGATTLTITGSLSAGMGDSQSAALEYSINNGGAWYTLAYTTYWGSMPSGPWTVNLPNGQDPRTVRVRIELTASGGALAYGSGPGSAYASISDIYITGDVTTAAPTNLAGSAAGNGTSVSLTWTDNAINESSYKIQRCTGSGCTPTDLVTGRPANSASYSDTTAANTTYRYNVCAVNAAVTTCAAAPITVTTPAPPAAPTNLAAGVAANGLSVSLTWTDNANNESSYKVQRCLASSCSWVDRVVGLAANSASYSDTTAVNTAYQYNVCAVNAVGATCAATPVPVTTPAPPLAPGGLAAAPAPDGRSVSLAWTDNATNETSYKIQRCAGLGCTLADRVTGQPANTTTYNDSTSVGTTYRYNVCAVNAVGVACGETPVPVTTAAPPAMPTNLVAISAANGLSVSLTWADNATNETSYTIQRCTEFNCTPADFITGRPANSVSYSDTTTKDTLYRYSVCAVNAVATSCAAPAEVTTMPDAPATPTSLTARVGANGLSVSLTWVDNANNEVSFTVQRCEGSGCTPVDFVTGLAVNSASYSDTTSASTTYRYNVCAVNAAAAVCTATPVTITTARPAAPSNLAAAAEANGLSVSLTWADRANNESSYTVRRCVSFGILHCAPENRATGLPANSAFYSDTTEQGTIYRYTVCAVNALGTLCAEPVEVQTPFPPPAAPTNLTATLDGSAVRLNWTDNATNEKSYTVQRCTGTNCTPVALTTGLAANLTSYSDTTVVINTSYSYNVCAVAGITMRVCSNRVVPITVYEARGAVAGTYVSPDSSERMYEPSGALHRAKIGSCARVTNVYNNRLQPSTLAAENLSTSTNGIQCDTSGGTGTFISKSYDFHSGNGNNGNVYAIIDNLDPDRSVDYTYDNLNRITSAQSRGTDCTPYPGGATKNWGESYSIDPWGNMNKTGTKCSTNNFIQSVNEKNQFTAGWYDPAGNMVRDIVTNTNYSYDAESRILSVPGQVTYGYDGDGNRIIKNPGKLYWAFSTMGSLAESDLTGRITAEYIYFDGKRVARIDYPTETTQQVHYYFSDHLGSATAIAAENGKLEEQSEYYPYGGERVIFGGDSNVYKFTGKERDGMNENGGLDYFGARYYGSNMGRFLTPDWAANATAVPYANFGDPQSLNLYGYVRNSPLELIDTDGHAVVGYVLHFVNGEKNNVPAVPGAKVGNDTATLGPKETMNGVYYAINVETIFDDDPGNYESRREGAASWVTDGVRDYKEAAGSEENPDSKQIRIDGNSKFVWDAPGRGEALRPQNGVWNSVFQVSEYNKNEKKLDDKKFYYQVAFSVVNGKIKVTQVKELTKDQYDRMRGNKQRKPKRKQNNEE